VITTSTTPDIEEHRTHLVNVGYRITGSLTDAEDAVQEAWLRMHRLTSAKRAAIRDPRRWLTTVLIRLCLDRRRSNRERCAELYPRALAFRTPEKDDPLATVLRAEDIRAAAMIVLVVYGGWRSIVTVRAVRAWGYAERDQDLLQKLARQGVALTRAVECKVCHGIGIVPQQNGLCLGIR